ncbi:hypothetical protein [Pseudonocardia nigra]|uniref:hypothetical protein n=1 Tax=Pseudonocardia nigra TaxID=1921578 RepID=UPI001C5EDF3F|nr:hypothetical protein [Pseudonocardia nigra]
MVAVTAADASWPSRPVTARLRLLEPHTSAVVVLPYVRRWRDMATPLDDLRDLLARPLTELPRQLRRYAATARELHTALGSPPVPPRPPTRSRAVRPAPFVERIPR